MALTTSLAGRVRNTSLPKSHALLPLLEAVRVFQPHAVAW